LILDCKHLEIQFDKYFAAVMMYMYSDYLLLR